MKTKTLLITLAVIMLASCEKVVDFDFEEVTPLVVVNSLPCTDSQLFVSVTFSRFFLDNSAFSPVDNATLTLDINGTTLSSTMQVDALHFFAYRATAGDSLTLRVAVPGIDDIIGGTRIIPCPDMTMPTALIDTLQPLTQADVSFSLSDPSNLDNYYYIYVLEHDSGSLWNEWERRWDTIDTVIHSYFSCLNVNVTDPSVNLSTGLFNYFNELLFTDSLINGTSTDITVSIPMLKDTSEHPLMRQYTLVVESLSPQAFRYTRELKERRSMTSYFAEPTRLYSNLSSGVGIFASVARRQYHLSFSYKEQED